MGFVILRKIILSTFWVSSDPQCSNPRAVSSIGETSVLCTSCLPNVSLSCVLSLSLVTYLLFSCASVKQVFVLLIKYK